MIWSVSNTNHSKLHNPSSFPNADAKGGEADQFYEDLPHLVELTPKKKVSFLSQVTGMQKQEIK